VNKFDSFSKRRLFLFFFQFVSSAFVKVMDSDDLEDNDLILVDLLTPTLLLPSSVQHKDLVKECVSRLELPSEKAIKVSSFSVCVFVFLFFFFFFDFFFRLQLYYLIDSETLEQQNHRMAIVVQDSSEQRSVCRVCAFFGWRCAVAERCVAMTRRKTRARESVRYACVASTSLYRQRETNGCVILAF
jgi:hypothetical protein